MDRKRIRKQLLGLLSEKPRTEILMEPTPPNDVGDVANASSQKEGTAEQCERLRIKQMQIQVALDRLKDGSYGICLACESEISERRLKAVPWTPFCLKCQMKLDERNLPGFERYEAPAYHRSISIQ